MDHSWRPRPNQGNNICPTCSVSHFPFCPPLPHPSTYPGPNFEPIRGPFDTGRPGFSNNPDPYHDPGYWSRNPNLPGDFGAVNNGYGDNGSGGGYYSNNANVNDDRSSKRLRVDGSYPGGAYGGEVDANLSKPNSGFGFDGGLRRYPQESQELGNSRAPSKVDMGAWMHHGPEYNMGRREHGSHNHQVGQYGQVGKPSGPEYNMSRSAHESHDHQVGQYGQVGNPSGPGSFSHGGFGHDNYSQLYGYRPPNDGRSFEHMQPNSGGSHYDQRSNMGRPDQFVENRPPLMGESGHMGYGYRSPGHFGGLRQLVDSRPPPVEGYQSFVNQNGPTRPPFEPPHLGKQSGYGNPVSGHLGHVQPPQRFEFQPPLPASPPPPLPMEPPVHWSSDYTSSTAPTKESPSVFPPHIRPPVAVHYPQAPIPDSQVRANTHLDNFNIGHASHGTLQGDSQGLLTTYGQYARGSQSLPSKNNLPDKPKTVDASHLFKRPHRISRPDHFVIILRGLPGSGKSYFAKMLRDLELEYGGNAPRIHSMDDYFMTEVEKTEENESSKSSSRGKKRMTKTVIEYCYEPEMEEAYRSSMLKSFKKTLEEGVYTFVIVDDRNLRVADFAQFWATAKRSGYEAYVLEAPYKDPAGCTARNVHGFTQDEVEKMAARWEEAPSLYLQLDVKSLLHGDDLKESSIKEVDMDTEDEDFDASLSNGVDERQADKTSLAGNLRSDVSPRDESNSSAAVDNRTEEVKVLGQSKWSHNLDEDDDEKIELMKGKPKFLSGLLVKSGKDGKSVHWGDQGGRTGFSIGVAKKANMASLVIGPGEGYNLKSNPLPEDEATSGKSEQTKKHRMFQERLQAERESFKAVFDRRRQRIGGVLPEED